MTTVAPCCAVACLASFEHRNALGRVRPSQQEVRQTGAADSGTDNRHIGAGWKRLGGAMAE